MTASIVVIAVAGICAGTIVVCLIAIVILKTVVRGGSKGDKQTDAEETEMIQEMYHGFRKMEKRIESLETLLLDDETARRSSFDQELRRG